MFGDQEQPRLRYLLSAIKYADFARFAYVDTSKDERDVRDVIETLSVPRYGESILVFNDFPEVRQ